ncbi:MAG: UDP-3-O-(3-hydroxymyristoyl)glucosamine N-acyltransferase [Acidobacteriota bacterium]
MRPAFFCLLMGYAVSQLAVQLGLSYQGDADRVVTRVSSWEDADNSSLVFVERSEQMVRLVSIGRAGCVIAPDAAPPAEGTCILSPNPKLDFARAAEILSPRIQGKGSVHPTAVISPRAVVGRQVDIGPWVHIDEGASIGDGCVIEARVCLGANCRLGTHCILHAGVVLYPGVQLGHRVTLHSGVVVGADGFGYVWDGTKQVKFPQTGQVIVEDDVEVGANTTIDRGSLGITRIGSGTKIDNLVQVAHNVQIGKGVVIAAQTGISGSTVIEDFAVIGGQVGFGDHARVESRAVIGSKAGILPGKIVRGGETYWGIPIRPLREYKRLNALFGRLPEIKAEIDKLKAKLARLEHEFRDGQQ